MTATRYLDPELAGINNVPPASRDEFADILNRWLSCELTDNAAIDELCNFFPEDEAEEIMLSWNDEVEENDV